MSFYYIPQSHVIFPNYCCGRYYWHTFAELDYEIFKFKTHPTVPSCPWWRDGKTTVFRAFYDWITKVKIYFRA
jgi:hypothetical protein